MANAYDFERGALGRDAVSEQIKVSRPDLYRQVWSEPMTKVAAQYWISDVGLKKRCKTMGIPTPPRVIGPK